MAIDDSEDEDDLLEKVDNLFDALDEMSSSHENDFVNSMVEKAEKVLQGRAQFSIKEADEIKRLHKKYCNKDAFGTGP